MPPSFSAARDASKGEVQAGLAVDAGSLSAFAAAAATELEDYLDGHQVLLGRAANPGLAKRIAILAVHATIRRGLDLEAAIRLAAEALRSAYNPATVRKCASEARALASQLQEQISPGEPGFAGIVTAAAELSVNHLMRRRADQLLGSKGGRPVRRGAAVEAVVRAIDRARHGDPVAASELQVIRQILVGRQAG